MAKIAVVGGGFGGVYAIKSLCKRHKVTLFEPRERFVFTPLLHEVAGGVLDKDDVSIPYGELFHGVKHVRAPVARIDIARRSLVAGGKRYAFDYIIVATGSRTKRPRGMTHIKTVEDALAIRDTVIKNMLAASLRARKGGAGGKSGGRKDGASHLSHVVVVGGGATGVELAGECIDLMRYWARRSHLPSGITPRVTLVHTRKALLHNEHPFLGRAAMARLQEKGVEVVLGARVTSIKGSRVVVTPEKGAPRGIDSAFIIWSGGVAPNIIPPSSGYDVERTLQIRGYPRAFAIGDVSSTSSSYPALAQVASMQGAHAARSIRLIEAGEMPPAFSWKDKGRLVSVGQRHAVGRIMGVRLSGTLAWFIMRTVYLLKFQSAKYELRMAGVYTKRLFSRALPGKRV